MGSVPQYRYKSVEAFAERKFALKANNTVKEELKKKYRKYYNNQRKILGISWQGGGTKSRINDKSVDLNELLKSLSKYDINIISLQYGDTQQW